MTAETARAARRFAPLAQAYRRSPFHSSADALAELVELVSPAGDEIVLDVATGTGNAGLALAPRVEWVVGLDLTLSMLEEAASVAAEREIRNVTWVAGDAARLPFLDSAFDVYVVRSAPHHFDDLGSALREAARVLKPDGKAVLVDCSPPPAARDLLHEVELGRDATHVRSYTLEEWGAALAQAGFDVVAARRAERDWSFREWMKTGDVDGCRLHELEQLIESADGQAGRELRPTRRGGELWHRYWHAEIVARPTAVKRRRSRRMSAASRSPEWREVGGNQRYLDKEEA